MFGPTEALALDPLERAALESDDVDLGLVVDGLHDPRTVKHEGCLGPRMAPLQGRAIGFHNGIVKGVLWTRGRLYLYNGCCAGSSQVVTALQTKLTHR